MEFKTSEEVLSTCDSPGDLITLSVMVERLGEGDIERGIQAVKALLEYMPAYMHFVEDEVSRVEGDLLIP